MPPSPAEAPPEGWKRQYRFAISAVLFCVVELFAVNYIMQKDYIDFK